MGDTSTRKSSRKRKSGAKHRGSSQRWLDRQRSDPFTRLAAEQGRVSRAYFKLQQLDARLQLIRPGMCVLELGAAPGGWTSYVEARLGKGTLIACDSRRV